MFTTEQQKFMAVFDHDTFLESQKLVVEFEHKNYPHFISVRLTNAQLKRLSTYLCLLPFVYFQIMVLYYCCNYSYKRIEAFTKHSMARGTIGYCKDRLTQCMGLTRPIAERYWRLACARALDDYFFP